jgi:hypothetical protein
MYGNTALLLLYIEILILHLYPRIYYKIYTRTLNLYLQVTFILFFFWFLLHIKGKGHGKYRK